MKGLMGFFFGVLDIEYCINWRPGNGRILSDFIGSLALGFRLGDKKNNVDIEQVPLHNWETSSILGTIVKTTIVQTSSGTKGYHLIVDVDAELFSSNLVSLSAFSKSTSPDP
jgi:hypothetical protein